LVVVVDEARSVSACRLLRQQFRPIPHTEHAEGECFQGLWLGDLGDRPVDLGRGFAKSHSSQCQQSLPGFFPPQFQSFLSTLLSTLIENRLIG